MANEHPNSMMVKCCIDLSVKVKTLGRITKYAIREGFDDFVGLDTIHIDFAKGWIKSITDSECFGKWITVIDDGTRQVECYFAWIRINTLSNKIRLKLHVLCYCTKVLCSLRFRLEKASTMTNLHFMVVILIF